MQVSRLLRMGSRPTAVPPVCETHISFPRYGNKINSQALFKLRVIISLFCPPQEILIQPQQQHGSQCNPPIPNVISATTCVSFTGSIQQEEVSGRAQSYDGIRPTFVSPHTVSLIKDAARHGCTKY